MICVNRYLCIVFRPGQDRELVGGRKVCPDLLHLAKTLSLSPFGSAILEPHLKKATNNEKKDLQEHSKHKATTSREKKKTLLSSQQLRVRNRTT